jgi:ring-1,2-phenylacetyl-CoA epoxidase subunit PaaE
MTNQQGATSGFGGLESMLSNFIGGQHDQVPDDEVHAQYSQVARPLPQAARSECEVTVIQDGTRKSYLLTKGDDNILDAGLRNGIELPYSCKGGVCSTCRCRLVDGEVDMDVNFALEDYEVARGFILACQSYPVTDKVVVDFDQTGTG